MNREQFVAQYAAKFPHTAEMLKRLGDALRLLAAPPALAALALEVDGTEAALVARAGEQPDAGGAHVDDEDRREERENAGGGDEEEEEPVAPAVGLLRVQEQHDQQHAGDRDRRGGPHAVPQPPRPPRRPRRPAAARTTCSPTRTRRPVPSR